MSALKLGRDRMMVRAARVLASVLVAWNLGGAARAEVLPGEPETVLIGHRVDLEDTTVDVDTVRASFEVRQTGAAAEVYTLKLFDAGTLLPPEDVHLIAEQVIVVDGADPLQPGEVWIDEPPVLMKWETVFFDSPVTATSGAVLTAVEMSLDQLRRAQVVVYLEYTCEEASTYYSIDGGSTWTLLDDAALECLMGGGCEDNGSTYVRVHVRPG